MTATDVDKHLIDQISHLSPCEADPEWHANHGTGMADWVVKTDTCCFAKGSEHRAIKLLCTGCKDAALAAPRFECIYCRTVWKPGRLYLKSIEPLR